ncbi:hypothetical protein Hypma_001079 [Hypsizygus marmoreus]|uniref:Uncharacterized protein n=1 Tax=Hypsizygus marmoreus TaxID=39966 RepID=A0A369JDF9_HYPMA|nr:hypothetical protein Hypma_001079 [Hypsizygus marmoreus]
MLRFSTLFALFSYLGFLATASPTIRSFGEESLAVRLQPRTEPFFPETPASCPICAQNYGSINSCAAAAPVLSNFTNIIFNPGAFIDVIKCACADTFQSAYPQCVDCFIQTNQSEVLNYNTQDLPGIVSGMRKICGLESSLLGNVSETNGEVTHTTTAAPTPTSAASLVRSSSLVWGGTATFVLLVLSAGTMDLGL